MKSGLLSVKKLLFVMTPACPMPPVRGGAVYNLVYSLVKQNEKQYMYDMSVISIPDRKAKIIGKALNHCKMLYSRIPYLFIILRDKNIKYVSGIMYRIVYYLHLLSVKKLIANEKFDVIVFENNTDASKITHYKGHPKKILHLHNDFINIEEDGADEKVRHFDCVIAISEYIRKRVLEVSPNSKVYVIYNGIDVDGFKRDEAVRVEMRKELGIGKSSIVFCSSVRLVKEKGVLELVKAFNALPVEKGENAVLLIIGSKIFGSNNEDEFIKQLKEESVHSRYKIIYTGYVDYKEISRYYSASDVGCLMSICEEAFSQSVAEYKANGMPVIASDAGGIPEQLSDDFGILVKHAPLLVEDIRDAMIRYIDDRELVRIHGENAMEDVKKYSSESYCNNIINVIRKLLE